MIGSGPGPLEGALSYIESDHAFNFTPSSRQALLSRVGDLGTTSLSIGTLQIEVAVQTGIVLFVWGYLPKPHWKAGTVKVGTAVPGVVRVVDSPVLESGVSVDLASRSNPAITYDHNTGWIRVSAQTGSSMEDEILVATSTVLCLSHSELDSVLLHPEFL